MEWNNESALKLIDAYHARKLLWNHKHDDYKNRKKRFSALCELAEQFSTTTIEIERKLKNLTSHYYREQKKIKFSKKSNSEGGHYQSKWFAFKPLSFLHHKFTVAKKTDSNEVSQVNKNSDVPPNVNGNAGILKRLLNRIRPRVSAKKNAPQKQKRDEDILFAKYVTEQMKKMHKSTKTAVQNHIKRIFEGVNNGDDLDSIIKACAIMKSENNVLDMKPAETQMVEESKPEFTPHITPNKYTFIAPDTQTYVEEELHTNNIKQQFHASNIKEELVYMLTEHDYV